MSAPSNSFRLNPRRSALLMRQQAVDLVRQRVEIGEIHQADGAAADLVFIGGADAALRSAIAVPCGGFPQAIEFAMQRQDQRDVFGDAQIVRADDDALGFEFATSSRKACGSNTTPLPMTASFDDRSTPDGNNANL